MEPREDFDVVFFAPWIGPLITERPGTTSGGAETQILMLARGLADRGLRVGLVVFATRGGLPADFDGIVVVEVPSPRARRPLLRQMERALRIVAVMLRLRTRVVVQRIAGPETGVVAATAKLRRSRFVYSSANVLDFDYAKLGVSRLRVSLYHLGVRLADAVVVQTGEQAELCERRFARTPELIRSVAEPAEARSAKPEAFLWVGRTDWYKRPEAYLELARLLPDARFWMVAMPMDEEGLERVARLRRQAAGLSNLELLEPRPRRDLADLILRAVAIVNTSDHEGMSNVLLEGWGRGVPALALSHDPDGLIEREGLGAFAAGSPQRLAELAKTFWDERSDQAELARRCRDYIAREHSPDVVVSQWLDALALR